MKSLAGRAVVWGCVLAVAFAGVARAEVLFSDSFESGNLGGGNANVTWGEGARAAVSAENPKTGTHALRLEFPGSADPAADAWSEQRFRFSRRLTEVWVQYQLFVPANYAYRDVSPNNNKLLAIYRDPYGTPGFQVNVSTARSADGSAAAVVHYYHNGAEKTPLQPPSGAGLIQAADRGRWVEIVAHVKVPTTATSGDGVLRLWKDGRQILDETAMMSYGGDGANYIDQGYLLGWANSGFDQTTVFHVDNVVFSTTPPSPAATVGAPRNLSVRPGP